MSGNDFGWMTQRQGDRLSRQNEQILAQGRVLQRQQERTNEMLAEEAAKRAMAEQAVQEVFEISKRAQFIHQTKFRDPDLAALLGAIEVCYLQETKITPQHCPTLDGKNALTQSAELFTELSGWRSAGGYQAIELIWALRLEKELFARLGNQPYKYIEDGREEYWKIRDSRTTRWIILSVLVFISVLIPAIISSLSPEFVCAAIVALTILATTSYIFYKVTLQDVPFILNLQPVAERWLMAWQTFQSMNIRDSVAQVRARYPELDTMLSNRLLCHPLPPKTLTDTTYINGTYTPNGIVYQWRPGWYELRVGGFGAAQIQRVDLVRPQRIVFEDVEEHMKHAAPVSVDVISRQRQPEVPVAVSGSSRALLYGTLFAGFGFFVAQYYPLFSDPFTRNACMPWSPCRTDNALGYVIGGAILGIILGLISATLVNQLNTNKQ